MAKVVEAEKLKEALEKGQKVRDDVLGEDSTGHRLFASCGTRAV